MCCVSQLFLTIILTSLLGTKPCPSCPEVLLYITGNYVTTIHLAYLRNRSSRCLDRLICRTYILMLLASRSACLLMLERSHFARKSRQGEPYSAYTTSHREESTALKVAANRFSMGSSRSGGSGLALSLSPTTPCSVP
ncbi:hypothetical protein F4778DRAFT_721701 [Xylariomycetidae sp. FL2044]|nr:hypothetical protein F4778DRAFT_721701 [Xylariomycetidae sp. FL2044]